MFCLCEAKLIEGLATFAAYRLDFSCRCLSIPPGRTGHCNQTQKKTPRPPGRLAREIQPGLWRFGLVPGRLDSTQLHRSERGPWSRSRSRRAARPARPGVIRPWRGGKPRDTWSGTDSESVTRVGSWVSRQWVKPTVLASDQSRHRYHGVPNDSRRNSGSENLWAYFFTLKMLPDVTGKSWSF